MDWLDFRLMFLSVGKRDAPLQMCNVPWEILQTPPTLSIFATVWALFHVVLFQSDAAHAVMKTDGLQLGEYVINVAISCPPERKTPLNQRDSTSFTPTLGSGKKETLTWVPPFTIIIHLTLSQKLLFFIVSFFMSYDHLCPLWVG